MPQRIHPITGFIAMAMIALFWTATVISELSGSAAFVTQVKTLIPWGFFILIPALAVVGGTGFAMAGPGAGGVLAAKKKRMPFVAANGVLVLIPAALFLAAKARVGEFDAAFYAVQGVELIAGALNFGLLALNARDGLKMTARRRRARAP